MAISCLANDLVDSASCYCGIPDGKKLDILIALFANIAEVNTDANSLLASANCLCGIPDGRKLDVLIAVACVIANSGGTAKVCILGGVGPPLMAVPCNFAAYVQQPGPNFGLWLGDLATGWAQVVTQGP
jgi:hypothetical protein